MSAPDSLNSTHDPALRSWIVAANRAGTDFPIQNLPFGVFRRSGSAEPWRGGVAIGDQILDLAALSEQGLASGTVGEALAVCSEPVLNTFMGLGAGAWSEVRLLLSRLLREGAREANIVRSALVPQLQAELALPANIGDYTDFYASVHHATAVGKLFRPDNPLLPNYKWVPIAYHGRTSTIGISGQTFNRPSGQIIPSPGASPEVMPTRRLDYELEVGIFIGKGTASGTVLSVQEAEQHIFGLCLLNDWSARDVQAWEYQPLGPFLAKNFATTISPWIVTLEALAPFRAPWRRPPQDPQPLPYLEGPSLRSSGSVDMHLESYIETEQMRSAGSAPHRLSESNFRESYWSIAQMVAHHASNGCSLRPGDLLGSGTQSGPLPQEAGSLLELTSGGKEPLTLASGEKRTFLVDGDRVTFRAWCERPGQARIGFGAVYGTVLPARASQNAK